MSELCCSYFLHGFSMTSLHDSFYPGLDRINSFQNVRKERMSVQKVTIEQFTGLTRRLDRKSNMPPDFHAELSSANVPTQVSGTTHHLSSGEVEATDLDRYYATPGEAEWG